MPTCSLLLVLLFSILPFLRTKVSYRFSNSQIWHTQISQDLIGLQLTCQRLQLFKQRCQIYFDIKDNKEEKQVSHILFFTGDEGLRRYNSWGLADADKSKLKVVWEHFEKAIVKPRENILLSAPVFALM